MTIYALHRYSKRTDTVGALEAFPSVERASVALQLRARKQESGTFYVDDPTAGQFPRPVVQFPEADLTGYMLVWRRRGGDERPAADAEPEELWRLTENGGVIKEPYTEGKSYTLPELSVEERRANAIRACFEMQPVPVSFHAETDGMLWRRILKNALSQDAELEEAVLRLIAPFIKMPPKEPRTHG